MSSIQSQEFSQINFAFFLEPKVSVSLETSSPPLHPTCGLRLYLESMSQLFYFILFFLDRMVCL